MDTNILKAFKRNIGRRPVLGPFSKTSDPAIIETLGFSGFDFVILDLEHGPNSVETAQNLVRAAERSRILPIVRTEPHNNEQISRVLDVGAAGVQVPHITSAGDAREALSAAKFAPAGNRGVS